MDLLTTIAIILLVLWLLGLVSSYTIGGFISHPAGARSDRDIDPRASGQAPGPIDLFISPPRYK